MPTVISNEWSKCISELLNRHGLTYRDARRKGNYLYSHTSIGDWAREGIVPRYSDDLPRFLEAISSREEAAACLKAAGLPMPPEWPESKPRGKEEIGVFLRTIWPELPQEAADDVAARIAREEEKHKK
jgi:hypothetical protein